MSNIDTAKIYAELTKLNIPLDYSVIPNPAFIQDRTVECNNVNWKVDKFSLEVTQELVRIRKLYKNEKFSFEARKRQALTNNEKIKKIPTGKEREAAVEELLEDDLRVILDLENELDALKDLAGAIKTIQDNIKETSSGVRVLMRTMETQVNRLNVGTKEDPEVADFHNTLAKLDELEEDMIPEDTETNAEVTPDESGDKVSEESNKTTSDEAGQDTEGEIVSTDSFLMDDSEDTEDHVSDEEPKEETPEETPAEAAEPVPTKKEPVQATGSKPIVVTGVADLDLSEIGIDLGDVESSEKPPEVEHYGEKFAVEILGEEPSPKPATKVADKKKEVVVPEVKKGPAPAAPVVEKTASVEISKKKITDIDLDDILNSLDSPV
jgi:hypothetical protein